MISLYKSHLIFVIRTVKDLNELKEINKLLETSISRFYNIKKTSKHL
jgi:hypothetical protein